MARQSRIDKYKDLRENVKATTNTTSEPSPAKTYSFYNNDTADKKYENEIKEIKEVNDSKKSVNFNEATGSFDNLITNKKEKNNKEATEPTKTSSTEKEEFDFMKAFSEFGFKKEEPKDEYTSSNEDTLIEPLTFEKINQQVDEELERALNRVRANIGQKDYNTRMDILNRIRKAGDVFDTIADDDHDLKQQIEEENYNLDFNNSLFLDEHHEEEANNEKDYFTVKEQPTTRDTYQQNYQNNVQQQQQYQQRVAEEEPSNNDDKEILKSIFSKFSTEEESSQVDIKNAVKEEKPIVEKKQDTLSSNLNKTIDFSRKEDTFISEHHDDDDEDEEETDSPIIIKVLNGVIIVLVIALICIAAYFAKVFLF